MMRYKLVRFDSVTEEELGYRNENAFDESIFARINREQCFGKGIEMRNYDTW